MEPLTARFVAAGVSARLLCVFAVSVSLNIATTTMTSTTAAKATITMRGAVLVVAVPVDVVLFTTVLCSSSSYVIFAGESEYLWFDAIYLQSRR